MSVHDAAAGVMAKLQQQVLDDQARFSMRLVGILALAGATWGAWLSLFSCDSLGLQSRYPQTCCFMHILLKHTNDLLGACILQHTATRQLSAEELARSEVGAGEIWAEISKFDCHVAEVAECLSPEDCTSVHRRINVVAELFHELGSAINCELLLLISNTAAAGSIRIMMMQPSPTTYIPPVAFVEGSGSLATPVMGDDGMLDEEHSWDVCDDSA